VGYENVRVWEKGSEMRLMAHLIQEKGKRRKKYLQFNREMIPKTPASALTLAVYQDTLKVESKGSGRKSTLHFTGISTDIEDIELERRGSASSLNSASSATSLKRRFSWTQSTPSLDKVDVYFQIQERMFS
jgi:hypothetical protein